MPIFPVEALKSLIEALEALIEDIEAKLDAWPAERGTDDAELELDAAIRYAALIAAIGAITGGATAAEVWAYATRRLTNLSDARAAKIDNLDVTVSSRLAAASYVTERGTDNSELEADAAIRYGVIGGYVDEIESLLGNVTYGLAALKALIDVAQTDLNNPDQYKADLTTLELRLSAIRAGYLDQLDFDLQGAIAALQTDLDNPAQYKADLTTLEARLSAVRAGYLDELDFALQEVLAALQTDLDNPDQYKADVSALALQATLLTVAGYLDTEIAAIITALETVQTDLDNPDQYKADVSGLATAAKLEDAMQKATGPDYDQDTDSLEAIREAIDTISVLAPAYGDIKVYPWAADAVLDADPDYTYTAEVSEAGTSYVEVGHFDFDEDTADIKGIFVNLVWAQKITGSGEGLVKWQMASGSNASPGAYADITDEVSGTLTNYDDKGRSGVVHEITGVPSQMPFTIRCVVKNVDATSAEAKIKSNSYIRVAYKRVS